MAEMEYLRPKTMAEALSDVERGAPLAGGTALTPKAADLNAVVDLQDLGLDALRVEDEQVVAGAMLTLSALVDAADLLPGGLRQACRLEASANLRNAATLAGTVMVADGRSPLVTALLALDASATIEPRGETVTLDRLLDLREAGLTGRLITSMRFRMPEALAVQQVARAPADVPVVCAALALRRERGRRVFGFALGGFGSRPIRVAEAEVALAGDEVEAAAAAAIQAFARAGDAWASAAYRAHVAGVLMRRLAQEVAA
jgi:carbon-monoxide dehydrogenase medium subunit